MAAWYIFYALALIASFAVQIILIYLQSRANKQAPHKSFKYILTGSYIVLFSIPIPYSPIFLSGLRNYMLLMQIVGWTLFVIGAVFGIVGAKLLFDRYVSLAKANDTHT